MPSWDVVKSKKQLSMLKINFLLETYRVDVEWSKQVVEESFTAASSMML